MYTILTLVFIGAIVGLIIAAIAKFSVLGLLAGGIIGAGCGYIAGFLLAVAMGLGSPKYVLTERAEIVALDIKQNLFVTLEIRNQYTEDTEFYHYYQKTASGGYVHKKVNVNKATIYEDAPPGTGWVEMHRRGINEPYDKWSAYGEDWDHIDIHIPKGTIARKFNLDLGEL